MNKEAEKTPIRTYIRIKPSTNACSYLNYTKETLTFTKNSGETLQYTLDAIFSHTSSQNKILNHIKPILKNIIKGVNSTVFCYGNTGSGKTYTMFGTDKNPGLVHNFVASMFEYFNSVQELFDIKTMFSYFQIYNEKVFDMFTNEELCLREFKDEVIIKNLTEKEIRNKNEFKEFFDFANKNRKVGSTSVNEFSSRSHTVTRLDCVVDNKRSYIYMIDLAGSENNKKTGNSGLRLVESTNINRSLFVLNQVVNAIINKSISIPYRDSKLTRVLKDSLGGNSACFILGCIEPEKKEETQRTLDFVSKSRKIICDVKSAVSAYIGEKQENIYEKTKKQIERINTPFCATHKKIEAYVPFQSYAKSDLKSYTDKSNNIFIVKNTHKRVILGEKSLNNTKKYKSDDCTPNKKQLINDNNTHKSKIINPDHLNICTLKSLSLDKKLNKKKLRVSSITSEKELLKRLNSENFIDVKSIKGIGDKRASQIIEYIKNNGQITELDQLKAIIPQKLYENISKGLL